MPITLAIPPKRGRPKKQRPQGYSLGSEAWVLEALAAGSALTGTQRYSTPTASVETMVKGLLIAADDFPLTRHFIEASLNVVGIPAASVTLALKNLRERPDSDVVCTPFAALRSTATDVYSLWASPTTTEWEALSELLALHFLVFDDDSDCIGKIAESYVYGVLRLSGLFKMPPKSKLGAFWHKTRPLKLDLIVTNLETGQRVGISIANQREVLYAIHDHYQQMREYRDAFGIPCVLIGSFLSRDVVKRLSKLPRSSHYELGRQLLPSEQHDGRHTRLLLEKLRPVIGPQPYELVPRTMKFPRPAEIEASAAIQRDLHDLPLAVMAALAKLYGRPPFTPHARGVSDLS